MKTNNFPMSNASPTRLAKSSRRDAGRPGLLAGLLGAACVMGVFGMLGLLYMVG